VNAALQVEPWDVTLRGLHRLARARRPARHRTHQPHPAGVLRPGSATAAVLDALRAHPGRWLAESEIVAATGRSRAAVTCGLTYLRTAGLVQTRPGPQRVGALLYTAAGRTPVLTEEKPRAT
jgi:hypothetical protein